MSTLVDKIKNFWLGSEETYDEGFDDLFRIESGLSNTTNRTNSPDLIPTTSSNSMKNKEKFIETSSPHLKVLEHNSSYSATNEVIVLEPTSFSQAHDVIQYLKKGSSIVLNLCKLDAEQSQRLIDFVCGGIYALDGSQKRVGEGVFLLVPNSMNINLVEGKENKLTQAFWSKD